MERQFFSRPTPPKIVRLEGAFLIAAYIAYSVMLYQTAGSDTPVPPPASKTTTQAPAQGNGQSDLPAAISPGAMPLPELTAPPATMAIPAVETAPVFNDVQKQEQGSATPGIQSPEVLTASETP